MKKIIVLAVLVLGFNLPVYAGMEDDPVLTKVMIDELEVSDGSENPLSLSAEIWVGQDLNKFWMKTDVESVDGVTEYSELQLLYSRAIAPYWDLQLGLRQDGGEQETQDWLVAGFMGLAPYFIETEAMLFVAEDQTALRLSAEYELMLTQRLVISPDIEVNLYAEKDLARGIGAGLANIETGLRMRYEIRREIAPYIGVIWNNLFGDTADIAKTAGGETESSAFVVGVRIWF